MRARQLCMLAPVLLAAACGKLGPPVRASHARAPAEAVSEGAPLAGEPRAADAPAEEEEEKR